MTTEKRDTRASQVLPTKLSDAATDLIGRERTFSARNYDPLPVVLSHGEGSWLCDVDGLSLIHI